MKAVFSVALALAAAVVLSGCDGTDPGTAAQSPGDAVNPSFVAFDAVGVTNISLSTSSDVTMSYASLDGSGVLRRLCEASDEPTPQETLAYIEKKCTRCDAAVGDALVRLYIDKTRLPCTPKEDFAVWCVAGDLYLIEEFQNRDPTDMVMFDFVVYDGREFRSLAPFERLPLADVVWDCVRMARANPAALNNIAAMLFNNMALRSAVSAEHINFLLHLAGSAGEPIACRNLAIYYASALATDEDKDYKRDFWMRRTSEAVREMQRGFKPVLEDRPIAEWP